MKQLEQLCRESAGTAIDYLLRTIDDPDVPANVRLQAAREVLDRGYGKPVDRQAVLNLDATGAGDAATLSRADLLRIAAGDQGGVEPEQAGRVLEVLDFTRKTAPENGDDPPGPV